MSTTLYNEPHFIKPLFPGFEDELSIPADFMKNLKGQKGETAMLTGRRKGKVWPVKINCRRFGDGWKQFVQDHDLQIGDCLLFRHEGNLVFYVLVFGHNTCEREYPPFIQEQNLPDSRNHRPLAAMEERPFEIEEHDIPRDSICGSPLFVSSGEEPIEIPELNLPTDYRCEPPPFSVTEEEPTESQQQNLPYCSISGSLERNKKEKTRLEAKASSFVSEHPYCVVNVTPASIKKNRLLIPLKFVREIGLYSRTYWVILQDENSDYWRAVLSYSSLTKRFCIGAGWAAYHRVHKLKGGDLLMVELVKNGDTPVFRVRKIHEDSEFTHEPTSQNNSEESWISKKYKIVDKASEAKANASSVNKKSYFLAEITFISCSTSQLHIPRSFLKQHLKIKECNEVILRDQEGRSWPAKLGLKYRFENYYITDGWKEFAAANELKLGDSLAFEFIESGERPIFNIYGFQAFSGKTREKSLPHFLVNMQISYCLRDRRLRIPSEFARRHGFLARKCSTLTITNEVGKSWVVQVRLKKEDVAFMHSGIMDFVEQNGIGEDNVFMLELVKGGDTPELKYYGKSLNPTFTNFEAIASTLIIRSFVSEALKKQKRATEREDSEDVKPKI